MRPIYSSVTCGDFYYGLMFISPISRSANALHTTELVAEASPSQQFFCFASKSRSTFFSPWTLIVSGCCLIGCQTTFTASSRSVCIAIVFFCFASVSILTLFLKGSSANAWVELLPITDPINNTIEGISMVFEFRFIVFLRNFQFI